MNIPYVFKKCSKCGKILLATTDNFYKKKTGRNGLMVKCKKCASKENKEYREQHKEEITKYRKEYYEQHKEQLAVYNKEYYEQHKEEIAKYQKEYNEQHKEEKIKYNKKYNEQHKEEISKQKKEYHASIEGQTVQFNKRARRRARIASIGGEITPEQWQEVYNFFDWQCAYSGEKLNKDNRSLDHIQSIVKGGTNNIWNVVPMLRNFNSSKHDKDMLTWYQEQPFYSEERLEKILEWVEYARSKYEAEELSQC